MLTSTKETVNTCTCDECGHVWKSFTVPVLCPGCRTRKWNGVRVRGRPRNPLSPIRKPAKKHRGIPEYDAKW